MAACRKLSLFDNAMAMGGSELVTGTPTVISAAIYFEELPTREALESLVRDRLLRNDVLSGRPESGVWQPTEEFDMERHVMYHEVAGEVELDSFIQTHATEPLLNRDEGPWWEMHAVSTFEAGARELLLFRIEHACADGIALFQLLNQIATTEDGQQMPLAVYRKPPIATDRKPDPCTALCQFVSSFLK